jgi:hypothetical protein
MDDATAEVLSQMSQMQYYLLGYGVSTVEFRDLVEQGQYAARKSGIELTQPDYTEIWGHVVGESSAGQAGPAGAPMV